MRILLVSENDEVIAPTTETVQPGKYGCSAFRVASTANMSNEALKFRADIILLDLTVSADQRLSEAGEMLDGQAFQLVGIGPSDNAALILRALQAGASRYIDRGQLRAQLPIELTRMRDLPKPVNDFGRVFAILGSSGGCGVTTIATNLAASLLKASDASGKGTLLIDLNSVSGDIVAMLKMRPERTLADFCNHSRSADRALFEKCISKHVSGLDVLAAPIDYHEVASVTSQGVRKAISLARHSHQYIVIDVPRDYSPQSTQALMLADIINLVLRLDFPSLRQAARLRLYLNDSGIADSQIRVIVNATGKPSIKQSDVEHTLKLPVTTTLPEEMKVAQESVHRGVSIVSQWPRSRLSEALSALAAAQARVVTI